MGPALPGVSRWRWQVGAAGTIGFHREVMAPLSAGEISVGDRTRSRMPRSRIRVPEKRGLKTMRLRDPSGIMLNRARRQNALVEEIFSSRGIPTLSGRSRDEN